MTRAVPRPRGPHVATVLRIGRDQLGGPIGYFDALGDTFGIDVLGTPILATREPAVFEAVLIRQHRSFSKDKITRSLSKLLGEGLVTSEGETWRKNRRLLLPHFQPGPLASHLPVFVEEADRESARWVSGEPFDLHRAMARMSLHVALRALFGSDGEERDEVGDAMREATVYFAGVFGTGITAPLTIPTPANRRFLRARSALHDILSGLLARARQQGAPNSVLGSLLSAHESGELSRPELLDEAMTMLVAGHEASALTLTYTLALLATHPEAQRTIRDELDADVPRDLDAIRKPSALNRAIKESLRLYPPTWAVGREALEPCEIAGYPVARGTQVYLYQWALHRHPAWFEEPARFTPDRWTPELEARLPRGAYSPFGAGPRVCIGNHFALAQVNVLLAALLARFHFEAKAPFRPALVAGLTLRPKHALPIVAREHGPSRRRAAWSPSDAERGQ